MADQLYLSLWFPNFRLEALPQTLTSVLRQFATVAKEHRVTAATAYPIDFTETPTYQRIYVNDDRAAETPDVLDAAIDLAVAEATEQLHDDMAYEFEMKWHLWYPEGSAPPYEDPDQPLDPPPDDDETADSEESQDHLTPRKPNQPIPFPSKTAGLTQPTGQWKRHATAVHILGFGPEFDKAGYAQNGHIRIDFGLDTPWTLEESATAPEAAKHTRQNIEMLLAFTLLVEKHCNISSRLLWTESGEPLVEKLIARLQKLN